MSTATLAPPPLVHGQRLDDDEFMRRYEAMPDVKAELLNGVVYIMASPIKVDHGTPQGKLIGWLFNYEFATFGVEMSGEATTRLSGENIPQPDAYLRILESHGGNSFINEDRYIEGAPELLVEIALSSLDRDQTVKKPIYQQAGVREFILWNVEEQIIEWSILRGEEYAFLTPGAEGIVRSETFPGLWLDVEAMVRLDVGSVVRALQQGIASPEHARFIEQLQAAAKKG